MNIKAKLLLFFTSVVISGSLYATHCPNPSQFTVKYKGRSGQGVRFAIPQGWTREPGMFDVDNDTSTRSVRFYLVITKGYDNSQPPKSIGIDVCRYKVGGGDLYIDIRPFNDELISIEKLRQLGWVNPQEARFGKYNFEGPRYILRCMKSVAACAW